MSLRDKSTKEEGNEPGIMPEHVVDSSSLISTMEVWQPMSSIFPILMHFKVGKKTLRQKQEA